MSFHYRLDQLKQILYTLIVVLTVVGLGLFSINQFTKYIYANKAITNPCGQCVELNPEWKMCQEKNDNQKIEIKNNFNINLSTLRLDPIS